MFLQQGNKKTGSYHISGNRRIIVIIFFYYGGDFFFRNSYSQFLRTLFYHFIIFYVPQGEVGKIFRILIVLTRYISEHFNKVFHIELCTFYLDNSFMHRFILIFIPLMYPNPHQTDYYGNYRINGKFNYIVKIFSSFFPGYG